jgi:hypothetical protein
MTENVTVVEEPTVPTKARFNVRKTAKIAGAATAAVALIVVAKRKLNGSVDGALTATVETDSQS